MEGADAMKRLLILSIILFGISGQAGLKSIPVAKTEKSASINRVGYISRMFSDDEPEELDSREKVINERLATMPKSLYLESEYQNFEIEPEPEPDVEVSKTKTITWDKLLTTVCTTLQQVASATNKLARAVLVVAR